MLFSARLKMTRKFFSTIFKIKMKKRKTFHKMVNFSSDHEMVCFKMCLKWVKKHFRQLQSDYTRVITRKGD